MLLNLLVVTHSYILVLILLAMELREVEQMEFLTPQERAYLLDKISNSSFYVEKFGGLDFKSEERMIVSIFLKLQAF